MTDRCHACGAPIESRLMITAIKGAVITLGPTPCLKCGEAHPTRRKSARPVAKGERKSTRTR